MHTLDPPIMNKFIYSLLLPTTLLISACGGGGGSSNDTNIESPTTPTQPPVTTQNILSFPITQFKINKVDIGTQADIFSIQQNNQSLLNTLISEESKTLYQQNTNYNPNWLGWQEFILTKNKLYYSANSQHPLYVIKNADSVLELAYDVDGKGLKSTIKFKNISIANETVNSKKITTDLFNNYIHSDLNDANFIKLSNAINALSFKFDQDAVCHQYLSKQFNQANIIFSESQGNDKKTLEDWKAEQAALKNTIVEATWANHKVAYVVSSPDQNFYIGLGYRQNAAIEKDGKLYEGLYDDARVYDYREEYDSSVQFSAGICQAFNSSAAATLYQAILTLPKQS